MNALQAVVLACLVFTIAASSAAIYFTRQATKNWREAEANWKKAAESWEEVARLRGERQP